MTNNTATRPTLAETFPRMTPTQRRAIQAELDASLAALNARYTAKDSTLDPDIYRRAVAILHGYMAELCARPDTRCICMACRWVAENPVNPA